LTWGFALSEVAKVKQKKPAGIVAGDKSPILTSKLPPNLDAPLGLPS
jgi:hypothetical protein